MQKIKIIQLWIIEISLLLLISCSGGKQQRTAEDRQTDTPQTQKFIDSINTIAIGTDVVASGLDVPWEITWGPDNWIWFTEQKGLVRKVNPFTGQVMTILSIPDVYMKRAVGLLGMAFYPDIEKHPYVFVDYSYMENGSMLLKLVRYIYHPDTLTDPVILLDNIPATETHNGSRLVFDNKGKLLMTTGDIDEGELSQDIQSLNGKILRLNIDGTIPDDNPIPGSPLWSWGHRNPQGLVYAPNGILYSSEHGDVTDDEINLILKGHNYGWPEVEGFCDLPEEERFCKDTSITEPLKAWTPTIAPSGIDYYNSSKIPEWENSILVCTLKGASLRVLKLNNEGNTIIAERIYFSKEFGRLRDICVSPSGDVYISTSNRDWNRTPGSGFPKENDDRIIKITVEHRAGSTEKGSIHSSSDQISENNMLGGTGNSVYNQYCESCHKSDGKGLKNAFPSLVDNLILKNKEELIKVLLRGKDDEKYLGAMPKFDFLSDEQIANVSSYIRNKFGNNSHGIKAIEVSRIRLQNRRID